MSSTLAAIALLTLLGAGEAAPEPELQAVAVGHLYDLADVTGVIRSSWGKVSYDRARREAFVAAEGFVRVFNNAGMQVHRFGDDGALGTVVSVAVLEDGQLIVFSVTGEARHLYRCDFRGRRVGEIVLRGLPSPLDQTFRPQEVILRQGKLWVLDPRMLRVVVTDLFGGYLRDYDLEKIVQADPKKRDEYDVAGMDVDEAGNLVFTVPMLSGVFVVNPAGEVRGFGKRGSSPGKFNIVGAVAMDEGGSFFVLDRLRSVVLVFDRAFRFLGEFGYRGDGEENLVTPYSIAVGNGLVFVTQGAGRGVRVFRVSLQ
jgi:hypothetical protein